MISVLVGFARRPAVPLLAVALLALGLGTTTAVFTAVYSLVLERSPWPDSHQIVRVGLLRKDHLETASSSLFLASRLDDLQESSQAFQNVASFAEQQDAVLVDGETSSIRVAAVSPEFFRLLGVGPSEGSLFGREDATSGRSQVAVVAHHFATRYFSSPGRAVGARLTLQRGDYTILGVMPPGFDFPAASTDLWLPLESDWGEQSSILRTRKLPTIARLSPEASVARAQEDGQALLDAIGLGGEGGWVFSVKTLRQHRYSVVREPVRVLLVLVILVLAMSLGNVVNLLVARGLRREQELATRLALGARRSRLFLRLLSENMVLVLSGALLGGALAIMALTALQVYGPRSVLNWQEMTLKPTSIGFGLVAGSVLASLFAAIPALKVSGTEPAIVLGRSGTANTSAGPNGAALMRRTLIVVQVASALVLTSGAALLGTALFKTESRDPGYADGGTLTFYLAIPSRYSRAQVMVLLNGVERELEALPGVESVGLVNILPPLPGGVQSAVRIEGQSAADDLSRLQTAEGRFVNARYFETLKIPMLSGRSLTESDGAGSESVVVISESFARGLVRGDPLGRTLVGVGRIVGVVGDVRVQGLGEATRPTYYQMFGQVPGVFDPSLRRVAVALRAPDQASLLASAVRERLQALDPLVALNDVQMMSDRRAQATSKPRFLARVLGGFAAVAQALAFAGVWGLVSLETSLRQREIGIRLALGERRTSIIWRALVGALRPALLGVLAGVVAGLAFSRGISSLLYGVSPSEPFALFLTGGLLLFATLVAGLGPAVRCVQMNPAETLRDWS